MTYYPDGGIEDFRKSYDSVEEAVTEATTREFNSVEYPDYFNKLDWYIIFDSQALEVLTRGGDFMGRPDKYQFGPLLECKVIIKER